MCPSSSFCIGPAATVLHLLAILKSCRCRATVHACRQASPIYGTLRQDSTYRVPHPSMILACVDWNDGGIPTALTALFTHCPACSLLSCVSLLGGWNLNMFPSQLCESADIACIYRWQLNCLLFQRPDTSAALVGILFMRRNMTH